MWQSLPARDVLLVVAPRHDWIEVLATGALILVLVGWASSLGNGFAIIADYQTTALLAGVGCAAVEMRSFNTAAQWIVFPMGWFKISVDPRLNNYVGVVVIQLILVALDFTLSRGWLAPVQQRVGGFPTFSLLWAGLTMSGLLTFGRTKYGLEGLTAFGGLLDAVAVLCAVAIVAVVLRRLDFSAENRKAEYVPLSEAKLSWSVMPLPTHFWRPLQPGFVARWGVLFNDYAPARTRFGAAALSRNYLVALVLGLPLDCSVRALVSALLLAVYLAAQLYFRPARDWLTNLLRVCTSLLHAVFALSLAVSAMHPMIPGLLALLSAVVALDVGWCLRKVVRHRSYRSVAQDFVPMQPL